MAIQKTDAIVLKKFDFRDTSLIVTFFTRDFGRLKAVVKGVRKEGSPELVNFEILNYLNIIFYEKSRSDLHLVSETFLENPMLPLRKSFQGLAYGSFLAELIDSLYEVHEISPLIFDGFLRTLENLSPEQLYFRVLQFELLVLRDVGLFPSLKNCARCAASKHETFCWSSRQGGLLCGTCSAKEAKTIELAPEFLALIQQMEGFLEIDQEQLQKVLKFNNAYATIEKLVRNFINMRVEFPLKSSEFLTLTDKWRKKLQNQETAALTG